jgi:hypothetical protein
VSEGESARQRESARKRERVRASKSESEIERVVQSPAAVTVVSTEDHKTQLPGAGFCRLNKFSYNLFYLSFYEKVESRFE